VVPTLAALVASSVGEPRTIESTPPAASACPDGGVTPVMDASPPPPPPPDGCTLRMPALYTRGFDSRHTHAAHGRRRRTTPLSHSALSSLRDGERKPPVVGLFLLSSTLGTRRVKMRCAPAQLLPRVLPELRRCRRLCSERCRRATEPISDATPISLT
jgi:hypothetical protein